MTQKSEDLRVRRTRKMLQRALIELTAEKGFANVTVRDLTERAMVNRSTFYRHYLDKYDLLQQYIEEIYALIEAQEGEAGPAVGPDQPADEPAAGLVNILRQVQEHADFFRVMLSEKGDPGYCAQSFRQLIEMQFDRRLPAKPSRANPDRPPMDLSMNYVLHAGIGAVLWWLENGQPSSPEQVARWLSQLSNANFNLSIEPDQETAGQP